MQTLFAGRQFKLYREGGEFYLKNGATHKIEQGQANTLVGRISGLNDIEAENLITREYEQGNIKTITEKDLVKECHNRKSVERNIYQKVYNGELKNAYLVRVKIKGKLSQGSFSSLVDARKFRDAVKGYTMPPYKSKETKRHIEQHIIECRGLKGVRYMAKFMITRNYTNNYYCKRFETIEEARQYRDKIKNENKEL